MRPKLIWMSLLFAFLFVFAVFVLGGFFDHTDVDTYLGYLLGPGAWFAYGVLDGNVHELSPFIITVMINILFYWVVFGLLLGLLRRRKARKDAKP
jgi:hypothetical protein